MSNRTENSWMDYLAGLGRAALIFLLGIGASLISFAAIAQTTLSVNPTLVVAGGTVTVTWNGIAAPSSTNWIGLYTPGALSQAHGGTWMYVSCSKTAATARPSGSCAFPIPSGLAGSYELRLHAGGSWTSIATATLKITGAGGTSGGTTLTATPVSATPGSSVTVSWAGIVSPSGTNWIGLYVPGTSSQNHGGNWMYVSCIKTAGAARLNGSCAFPIPGTLAAGTYEFRLHASASWTAIATAALTITAGSGTNSATLRVEPTSVAAGATVAVTWSNIASPSRTDWIGLYLPGAGSQDHGGNWVYVSCTQGAGSALSSGTCAFSIPSGLTPGNYEMRLHSNGSMNVIATSIALTVTAGGSAGAKSVLALEHAVPSFGSVGVRSAPFLVKVTGTVNNSVRVTPNDSGAGGSFAPTSLLLSPSVTQASFTYTPASVGLKTIAVVNDGQITNPNPMVYSAGEFSSNVVQFLTHDNSSGPSNIFWNSILRFRWKRGIWGDWLDAQQNQFGTSAAGAIPYASLAVPRPGRYTANVTQLVTRWQSNRENRGFYLRMRGNQFPVQFAGRTFSNAPDRPKLQITTTTGSYSLDARSNASWAVSSSYPIIKSDSWTLSGTVPAILQFDLSQVAGTITNATLALTDLVNQPGSTSANGVVDIFEADPPRFIVPDQVAAPAVGVAANYTAFTSLASDPTILFSDDFASPGWSDQGTVDSNWAHPVERIFNPQTSTTYARGQFVAGSNGSASVGATVHRGIGPFGSLTTPLPHLYGQYYIFLERDFGSNVDVVKFPGMSIQYGYWNPRGYWQSITGNGGSRGTGMKVWNASANRWEYHGHSVRMLIGESPSDASAYGNLFSLSLYPYNLDQADVFPVAEQFPYIALQRERWYAIDTEVKQNSVVGPFDAIGNGAAVADGVCRVWINGVIAHQKTTYRWRKHIDFGVQGLWMNFYHGGVTPAPYTMHYRTDRVSVGKSFIGPLGGVVAQ